MPDTSTPAAEVCAHQFFEKVVELTPDAPAATFAGSILTYAELNRRANRLAHYLIAHGVKPEVRVGIALERSLEMLVGVLAVLKAEGAYVPLDASLPWERLSFLMKDSHVALVLTETELKDSLPLENVQAIVMDAAGDIASQPDCNVSGGASLDTLAYLIYTSGSTGLPKGVEVTHRGIGNMALDQIRILGIKPQDRILQFASLSFDASVSEIFMALLSGACLCLATRQDLMPGAPLKETVAREAVTVLTLPPSLMGTLDPADYSRLRIILAAGEACPADLVQKWAAGRRMFNAYGPTECTVCATMQECEESDAAPAIGHPIANTRVYILDAHGEAVPFGATGEICVAGPGVARGYANQPELTVEKFIDYSSDRVYRTGDSGSLLPDGRVQFLGRMDEQVKIRGFRVEPGEVEAVLKTHPSVDHAVVTLREDRPGDKKLVAYFTPRRKRVELWPSVAEYFVYDDLLYYAMTSDQRRNESYFEGMGDRLQGTVVLDIGAGPETVLSQLCVRAGARKVYAVELLEETARKATAKVKELGLEDRIEVIHGDIAKVVLPEKVDACVSEIVGPIGGSEGAAWIMNRARPFLKPGAHIIPQRSTTRIAAFRLPPELAQRPAFSQAGASYVEKSFGQVGYPFDLRVCLKGVGYQDLVSDTGVFEDLDFTSEIDLRYEYPLSLTICRDGEIDGFLVWLNLYTGGEEIDILAHDHCWIPVFLPAFNTPVEVSAGDRIEGTVSGAPCENGINPDYRVKGRVVRQQGPAVDFDYTSGHFRRVYRATKFYERLWEQGTSPVQEGDARFMPVEELRALAKRYLPDYMVPAAFVQLESLPLTSWGKLDRKALPAPDGEQFDENADSSVPGTPLEQSIALIWADVLGVKRVGLQDDFFALGGHSLSAVQVISRVQQTFGVELPLEAIFDKPTIGAMVTSIMANLASGVETQEMAEMFSETRVGE